jgi:hypothetical protein
MGLCTIYCPISGLPLEFSYENDNDNKTKYDHLNKAVVICTDGSVTKVGTHDGYGRIHTEDNTYSCNDNNESEDYPIGIALSYSVYKLMIINPKFEKFNNKINNLYEFLQQYNQKIISPVMNYYRTQCLGLENISKDHLIYFVDPFLEENIKEPLLGKTLIRGSTKKINGKKNKIHLNKLIDTFLNFIPPTNEEKIISYRKNITSMYKLLINGENISDEKKKVANQLIEDSVNDYCRKINE